MGKYFIFEGPDGAGKTTTMSLVAKKLLALGHDVVQTSHPGSTPLGKLLRQLVKYPQAFDDNIQIDHLSRQILYMVDTINFVDQILVPSMKSDKVLLSDRSSLISALIYGLADGLKISDIRKILSLCDSPRPNRLYILQTDPEVCRARLQDRNLTAALADHYDRQPQEHKDKIQKYYNNFGSGIISKDVLEAVLPIDTSTNLPFVTDNYQLLPPTSSAEIMAEIVVVDILNQL